MHIVGTIFARVSGKLEPKTLLLHGGVGGPLHPNDGCLRTLASHDIPDKISDRSLEVFYNKGVN
jgi:hypothetical protein